MLCNLEVLNKFGCYFPTFFSEGTFISIFKNNFVILKNSISKNVPKNYTFLKKVIYTTSILLKCFNNEIYLCFNFYYQIKIWFKSRTYIPNISDSCSASSDTPTRSTHSSDSSPFGASFSDTLYGILSRRPKSGLTEVSFHCSVQFLFFKLSGHTVAPWDWERIRNNYWKKPTLVFDPTGVTHQRLEILETLQDEMVAAAKERGTR